MLGKIGQWLGFGGYDHRTGHHAGHDHHHGRGHFHGDSGHAHTHGVIDPSIRSTARGVWAIKWSFFILAATAVLQIAVVYLSGSVALLADTIHNIGDAGTALPLWIAFVLSRRKPTKRFPYGLARAEDLAGIAIVLVILFSALVAGWQAIGRLIDPRPVEALGWLMAAGIVGFIGNEAVAVFRIKVGREMNSAALIADGYHARTDGLTSLAVVFGGIGVWLGFPLADPIVGLLITIAIFGIVWQSAKAVVTRMLDGVDPDVIDEIHHAAGHIDGILSVEDAKARWLGHALRAEIIVAVEGTRSVAEADRLAGRLRDELRRHIPGLTDARITVSASSSKTVATAD